MVGFSKQLIIVLVALFTVSSLIVSPAVAQSIPKPSIPHFTLNYTYTPDPVEMGSAFNSQDCRTIKITLQNQEFNYYDDLNDNRIMLWYNFQWKEHSQTEWHTFSPDNRWLIVAGMMDSNGTRQNTPVDVVTLSLGQYMDGALIMDNYPNGSLVDIKVKAFIGYYLLSPSPTRFILSSGEPRYIDYYYFVGKESDWSPTQTIEITDIPQLDNPTPSPTIPEFPPTATLIAVLAVVSLLLVISKRKQSFNH